MIHPDTCLKFVNDEIGFGVFATKSIPKGTITWALDSLDCRFTQTELRELGPLYAETMEVYTYRERNGNYVFCWDNARFVNHSFNSNCMTTAYNFEVSLRDIEIGEELTDDYGYLNIDEPFTPTKEEGSDRTTVYPDDLLRYHEQWDAVLVESLKSLPHVEQPLRPLISNEIWTEVIEVSSGKREMASILECYCGPIANAPSA